MNSVSLHKQIRQQLEEVTAILFHINSIEVEDDPEVIEIHIQALEEISKRESQIYPEREMIRRGIGDYAKIQKKCIRLNLV